MNRKNGRKPGWRSAPKDRGAGGGALALVAGEFVKLCATPHVVGDAHEMLELAALLVFGELVAFLGACKTALRTQAQALERHVFRGSIDAALECVRVFEVMSPSTTILSFGMKRSGAKSPERSSSYSRKNASTCDCVK